MSKEVWVEAELWGLQDEKQVQAGKHSVERVQCKVDSGSWHCVLPGALSTRLALPVREKSIQVTYADGRKAERTVALGLRIRVQGRDIETYAVIEPGRSAPLLGSIALEDLGFDIDMKNGVLRPSPGTESGQCTVIE